MSTISHSIAAADASTSPHGQTSAREASRWVLVNCQTYSACMRQSRLHAAIKITYSSSQHNLQVRSQLYDARQDGKEDTPSSALLDTAHKQFQSKKYDLCLLTLHTLCQTAGSSIPQEAEALTAICKIHKHAAFQDWHKV